MRRTTSLTAALLASLAPALVLLTPSAATGVGETCRGEAATIVGDRGRDIVGTEGRDVVVVAQAFHWLDHERALPEIARVLRPEGHLALVWNSRDERIPWVRRLGGTIGRQDADTSSVDAVVNSELFGFVEEKSFKHWQDVNRETFLDMARSRSSIATLGAEERAAKLAEVAALYDEYGRGMDGMQLPYVTRCFRAKVVDRDEETTNSAEDTSHDGPIVSDGTDTDMLLIDFR